MDSLANLLPLLRPRKTAKRTPKHKNAYELAPKQSEIYHFLLRFSILQSARYYFLVGFSTVQSARYHFLVGFSILQSARYHFLVSFSILQSARYHFLVGFSILQSARYHFLVRFSILQSARYWARSGIWEICKDCKDYILFALLIRMRFGSKHFFLQFYACGGGID